MAGGGIAWGEEGLPDAGRDHIYEKENMDSSQKIKGMGLENIGKFSSAPMM